MLLETANVWNNVWISAHAKYPWENDFRARFQKSELLISLSPNCTKLILGHVVSAERPAFRRRGASLPAAPQSYQLENNAFLFRATPAATSDQLFRHVLPQEVFKIFLTIRKYGVATSRYFMPFLLPPHGLMC